MHDNLAVRFETLERGRRHLRTFTPMQRDPATVLGVYDKIRAAHCDTGWESPVTMEKLLSLESMAWLVDDVGIVCVVMASATIAHAHVFFWDKRLRGREAAIRKFATWLMDTYGLTILVAALSSASSPITRAFTRRLGFKLMTLDRGMRIYVATRTSFAEVQHV